MPQVVANSSAFLLLMTVTLGPASMSSDPEKQARHASISKTSVSSGLEAEVEVRVVEPALKRQMKDRHIAMIR